MKSSFDFAETSFHGWLLSLYVCGNKKRTMLYYTGNRFPRLVKGVSTALVQKIDSLGTLRAPRESIFCTHAALTPFTTSGKLSGPLILANTFILFFDFEVEK